MCSNSDCRTRVIPALTASHRLNSQPSSRSVCGPMALGAYFRLQGGATVLLQPQGDGWKALVYCGLWQLIYFEVWRCRTSQFAMCFLRAQTRVWNDLPYTVFDTGTLDEFKGAGNRWLLLWVCLSVFRAAGASGVVIAIYKKNCFSLLRIWCWI